jgi:hypothetical protein
MRVIDCSLVEVKRSPLDGLLRQLRNLIGMEESDQDAQERIVARLHRGLPDNRFILLRNLTLSSFSTPIPLTLVGPTGIYTFHVSGMKGLFRVKEDSWSEMNKTTRRYQPARVNLIRLSASYAQAAGAYLDQKGRAHPEITPALLFSHPGVHVESVRPAIRLVLMDGIDRFIASLAQKVEVLNPLEVKSLTDTLESIKKIQVEEHLLADAARKDQAQKKAAQVRPVPQLNLPPFLANLRFNLLQWILLGVLAIILALVLLGMILMIVATA